MVYLIQGNVQTIFRQLPLVHEKPSAINATDTQWQELPFFDHHPWTASDYDHVFSQDKVTASHLMSFFEKVLLQPEDENDAVLKEAVFQDEVAYVNTHNDACCVLLSYRKSQPQQWVLGAFIKAQGSLGKGQLLLVSSQELVLDEDVKDEALQKTSMPLAQFLKGSLLESALDAPLVCHLVKKLFNVTYEEVHTNYFRMGWFYQAVQNLNARGITSEVRTHLDDETKIALLAQIDGIHDAHCKTLCSILWAKGALSWKELRTIISTMEQYPFLAKLLVQLDENKNIIDSDKLKKTALEPQLAMRLYIKDLYKTKGWHQELAYLKQDLKQLKASDLEQCCDSFHLLQSVDKDIQKWFYEHLVKRDTKGQLLRLFLPGFASIANENHRLALLQCLRIGVEKGSISLASEQKKIQDDTLNNAMSQWYERFICVKQMQALSLDDSLIQLASEENNPEAHRFRQVVLQVEACCKRVQELLRQSSDRNLVISQWHPIERGYKEGLYRIAYQAVTGQELDVAHEVKALRDMALKAVIPSHNSLFHEILVYIANVLITALSLGIANAVNKKYHGHYFFFIQTPSEEELRKLTTDMIESLSPASPV